MTDARSKNSGFDRDITVKKIVIQMDGQESMGAGKFRGHFPKSPKIDVHKKIKVSAGERKLGAILQPLEFKLLKNVTWDCLGDLEVLADTVIEMAHKRPNVHFAMSLCQLKSGRVFSMANRKPRVGLVVIMTPTDVPPIVLLDVERSGDVVLSLIALHFYKNELFDVIESSVKKALDGLVDASGHWDNDVEAGLNDVCVCERLPKMLTPRKNVKERGQTTLWAMKLLRRLGLEDEPREAT